MLTAEQSMSVCGGSAVSVWFINMPTQEQFAVKNGKKKNTIKVKLSRMFSSCAYFPSIHTSHAHGVRKEPVHSVLESVRTSLTAEPRRLLWVPPCSGCLLMCGGGCFYARAQSLLREHLFDQRRSTCSVRRHFNTICCFILFCS